MQQQPMQQPAPPSVQQPPMGEPAAAEVPQDAVDFVIEIVQSEDFITMIESATQSTKTPEDAIALNLAPLLKAVQHQFDVPDDETWTVDGLLGKAVVALYPVLAEIGLIEPTPEAAQQSAAALAERLSQFIDDTEAGLKTVAKEAPAEPAKKKGILGSALNGNPR